jgi:periplasmic protein TonB
MAICLGVFLFTQKLLVAFENRQGMVYAPVSGWDQAYVLWTFRNFRSLPQNVLNPRQQHLMKSLYRNRSEQSLRGLSDAFVVGRIEGFDPDKLAAFSTSRKNGASAFSPPKETPADVVVLDRDQRLRVPFHLGQMTLKIGAGALVAVIAVLGWHQLGGQPVSYTTAAVSPTPSRMAVSLTEESSPVAGTSQPPTVAPAALVPVTVSLPAAPPAPAISAIGTAEKPAVMFPAAHVAANTAPANRTGKSYRTVANTPVVYEASDDAPRTQISGRPRKLIYPVCPETRSRGKVSLQAVVEYDGKVSRVRVLTGDRLLAKAAVEAVRQWRYEPASGEVTNLERETNITVSFISNEVIAVSFPDAAQVSR